MGGGSSSGGDEEMISAINVTPLVDIVLVLLIILMVTANYIASRQLDLDVPKTDTGTPQSEQPSQLSVSVDANGAYFLDAAPITEDALRRKIVEAFRRDNDTRVIIAADRAGPYDHVANVIDIVRCPERDAPRCATGLTKLALNVRPRTDAPAPARP